MEKFSPTTLEHLGHYVYALINPKNDKIFYVGKGQGNRVFDHARAALSIADITDNDKLEVIRNIIASGQEVKTLILRHGLNEKEAFVAESVLIDLLTNSLTAKNIKAEMTNKQAGHDMRELGIRTVEDVEAQYGNTPLDNVPDRLVIININKTYIPKTNIYDATRGNWRLSKSRADKADYILSEYQGVVRAVFKMNENKWQKYTMADGKSYRYYFEGEEVNDPEILNRYMNKRIVKKKGDSYPIHYQNIK